MDALVSAGWAPRSRTGYGVAVRRYLRFTADHSLAPLPLQESVVMRYVGYLDLQGLAPATIKVYLSAIRAWVVSLGLDPPDIWTPRVHLMLKAITRERPPPRQAAPITHHHLTQMIKHLTGSRDHLLIASSITLQYFACLRASELCTDLSRSIIPSRSDISFLQHASRPIMAFRVRTSKTNPHGFVVHLGCSGDPVCAVCITHHYLRTHPLPPNAPLFQLSTGQHLTYGLHNHHIKHLLHLAGFNPALYSTHSLRAGAATQAARSGLAREDIKRLGRWRSQAYEVYLRPPPEAYADLAPALTAPPPPL